MPISTHKAATSSPPATYHVVLVEETTGRVVRSVTGISESAANTLCKLFDNGLDAVVSIGRPIFDLMNAAKGLGRALEPLTRPPRKQPPRRGRR